MPGIMQTNCLVMCTDSNETIWLTFFLEILVGLEKTVLSWLIIAKSIL